MSVQHPCHLSEGRTVFYSIVERRSDPYLFVRFRGPDGRRLEKTTKVTNRKRVPDAAYRVISEAYNAGEATTFVTWDDALARLRAYPRTLPSTQ